MEQLFAFETEDDGVEPSFNYDRVFLDNSRPDVFIGRFFRLLPDVELFVFVSAFHFLETLIDLSWTKLTILIILVAYWKSIPSL